jgi:hypothetical protein
MNFERSFHYYKSLFPIISKNKLLFESTPDYIDHPLAPERIFCSNPKTKFIVTLRNPVDRAYSHFNYVQSYNLQERNINFSKGIDLEGGRIKAALKKINLDPYNAARELSNYGYLRKGLYAEHLNIWLKYFPISQFYFIEFNEIVCKEKKVMNNLYSFLEVKGYNTNYGFKKKNVTRYKKPIDQELENTIEQYFKSENNKLFKLIDKKYPW